MDIRYLVWFITGNLMVVWRRSLESSSQEPKVVSTNFKGRTKRVRRAVKFGPVSSTIRICRCRTHTSWMFHYDGNRRPGACYLMDFDLRFLGFKMIWHETYCMTLLETGPLCSQAKRNVTWLPLASHASNLETLSRMPSSRLSARNFTNDSRAVIFV